MIWLDAQGGAERIKNTPMPKQYDYFPQLFVQIYCMLLPLALVTSMGWFTPLGSTLVGFIFLAMDRIGRDLEDPFENTIYRCAADFDQRRRLRRISGNCWERRICRRRRAPVDGVLW